MDIQEPEIRINPELMKFVIDSSGYSLNEIVELCKRKYANKSRTKIFNEEFITKLINGKEKIEISLLINLDENLFKRGIPFYFLNFIPQERMTLNFRRNSNKLLPKDRLILRNYQNLRYELKELMENMSIPLLRKMKVYSKNDNPKDVAKELRKKLEFDTLNLEKEKIEDIFTFLREKVEDTGIFIFKTDAQSVDRGLSLSGCIFLEGDLPSLILIKNQHPKRNVFTLLHEFAHYLINEGEDVTSEKENDPRDAEWWCNTFASFFVVPEEVDHEFREKTKEELIGERYENLKELSEKYKLSKLALMWRFYLLEIISYSEFLDFKSLSSEARAKSNDEIKIPRVNLVKSSKSQNYLRLLYQNRKSGDISSLECREKLNLRNETQLEEVFSHLQNG
jgi:Zn-dependent peptidase ImmA (M78 family)